MVTVVKLWSSGRMQPAVFSDPLTKKLARLKLSSLLQHVLLSDDIKSFLIG
jgi:hypothetical protein